MKLIEPDICPQCSQEFHCSKSARCWCYEVETSASLLEEIQAKYNSCLCPDCLKRYSEKSSNQDIANLGK
jgi:hypothetical protein